MATLYLIRHGQASFGSKNYDQLSELGCRQATLAGEYFRDCGVHFDVAYSGDLSRQRETARLVIASQPKMVPHRINPRFNEIQNDAQLKYLLPEVAKSNPKIQALIDKGFSSSKDYQKLIDAVFNYWVSPACEDSRIQSWAEFSGCTRQAIADVMQEHGSGKTIAVFTSGGTLATIVAQVLGLGGAQTYQFYEPLLNCSVTQLFYSGPKISLSYFNDCSFLQVVGSRRGENLLSYR